MNTVAEQEPLDSEEFNPATISQPLLEEELLPVDNYPGAENYDIATDRPMTPCIYNEPDEDSTQLHFPSGFSSWEPVPEQGALHSEETNSLAGPAVAMPQGDHDLLSGDVPLQRT